MRSPKTVVLDWHTWQPVETVKDREVMIQGMTTGAMMGYLVEVITPHLAYADAVPAVASDDGLHFNSDASWADYVIPMLRHQGLPLAITMCCWAALEMILRKPAGAIDRAKWAVVGYLGLQFVLPFLTGLGHRFGDV